MPKVTRNYRDMVEVLEENRTSPMTGVGPRDSDTELLIQMMQLHRDAGLNAKQLRIMREINFESITRARRKLQREGYYLPSPEVARKRRLKSMEVEQTAPKETAGGLQRRIESNV